MNRQQGKHQCIWELSRDCWHQRGHDLPIAPKRPRFALRGASPDITALRLIDGRGFEPVATAASRHDQSAPSGRARWAHSAVMPAAQPIGPRFALWVCTPGITAYAQVDVRGF